MKKLHISDKFTDKTIIKKLQTDLQTISTAIKNDDFSTITRIETNHLISQITKAVYLLQSETINQAQKKELKKLLRHFIFLLDKHHVSILSASGISNTVKLRNFFGKVSAEIGVTPRLNAHVKLPRTEFLPVKIEDSKKRWKKLACPNPSRTASTIAQGKVSFLSRGNENAVRAELKAQLKGKKLASFGTGSDTYALNMVDHEYYQTTLLDADHLLPASNLNERLQEMIEMMNYDPAFRQAMESSVYNDGYFVANGDQIVGSYWLYTSYHNTMQNLWFLLSSDNSGGGKVAIDPLEWLESNTIGRDYLDALRSDNKTVDKCGILYLVQPGGQDLKDSFMAWVEASNERLIHFCNQFAQFHHAMRQEMQQAIDTGQRLPGHREGGLILRRTRHTITHKDEDESSLSDNSSAMDTGDLKEIEEQTMSALQQNPEYCLMEKAMKKMEREELRKQTKHKLEDRNDNNTRSGFKPFT